MTVGLLIGLEDGEDSIFVNKRNSSILEMTYIIIPDVDGVVDIAEVTIKLPIAVAPIVVTYITCAV